VREAQQRCSAKEFAEWLAYDLVEPFGAWRDDHRSAVQTMHLMSAWIRGEHQANAYMTKFSMEQPRQQTEEQMKAILIPVLDKKPYPNGQGTQS